MFSFFYSEQKKMRQHAGHWLEMADRVYKYRRDQLNEAQHKKLFAATDALKLRLKEKAETSRIKGDLESLERVLREIGGRAYPVSSLKENVEFFLVTAIVLLGFRAYFAQNFKIPTNSMWPSYYGMTSEVFQSGQEPGAGRRVARMATLGASNYTVTAPDDGDVSIAVFGTAQTAYTEKAGRSMLILPAAMKEYFFSIGGKIIPIAVPADFAFDRMVEETFFDGNLSVALANAAKNGRALERTTMVVQRGARSGEVAVYWIPIGKTVKRGETILSFDILSGDLLFVDRFTYNFFPPKVGSGFVFRTDNIDSPNLRTASGGPIQQFYIKRLVGVPGDKLEIRQPLRAITDGSLTDPNDKHGQLFRNGQPIEGSEAFGLNSRKEGLYTGYTAEGLLAFGEHVKVAADSYFAMGDNSSNSLDSRYWGFVPDKSVVGRPLLIYYPLTKRWGSAK